MFNNIDIVAYLISIPIALISLTVHECAHGYVSYKLGDPTAKNLGRLTLNPFKHLDIIGTICMVVFHIGWAKPVPVNARYYKNPRAGMAITAAAGPISNLLLGFVCVILYKILGLIQITGGTFLSNVLGVIYAFLISGAYLNVSLAIFNLIPIPPFDGSRIAYIFLPTKIYFGIMKYERYIMLAMLVLLYFLSYLGIIGTVAQKVVYGMEWVVGLIPGL